MADIECRNCHAPGGDDLIAPCSCDGSIKYVHRSCLNTWRAVSPNPKSFTTCDVCNTQYVLRERPDMKSSRVWRFALYFARDFFGAMLVIQAIIVSLAAICWALDKQDEAMRNVFPRNWSALAVYYVWGLFVFSIIAALYGIILGLHACCCGGNRKDVYHHSHSTYPYGWGYYYIWVNPYPGNYGGCCPTCDCSCSEHCCACTNCACTGGGCGGKCDSNNGDGSALGMAALIVLIVGIVIGFIVMTVVATMILKKHADILNKRQDAREMEVVDLSRESIPLPTTPPAEINGVMMV